MDLYTVIGDMVASRRLADRRAGQDALSDVLGQVNASLHPAQAFEATVGDEYQGACARLGEALTAALLIRLTLLPVVDTRAGVGYGEVTVHDASRHPLLQDGPGWWAARDALDTLAVGRRSRRTAYAGPDAEVVNAYLVCRDQLLDRLNPRGQRLVGYALHGRTQGAMATAEGVSPSAVSQQFSATVGAVVESVRMLDAVPPPEASSGRP